MIKTEVNAQGLKSALRELKHLEPDVIKDLRADLRTQLAATAQQVASAVPARPPLSGFGNNGETGWTRVRGSVGFTPSKKGTSLVSIRVTPAGKRRGLYIAEMAGMRSSGESARGQTMIRNLNNRFPMIKRGGRFAFDRFRKLRPNVLDLAKNILKGTTDRVNKRLVR